MPPPDWKARYEAETGKIAALKQRIGELEAHKREQSQSLEWAKGHARRSHRGVPSVDVIRRSLALRLPVAQARARQPEAVSADRRFVERSSSFATAVAVAASAPPRETPILRSTLQGLYWWVPVLRSSDAEPNSEWLQKQKFPYRGIAQTRELAMGGVMLDLGANIGRMSLSRVILGDVTAVYCAEPDPLNYECLVRNVVDNGLRGLVFPDNLAIGDREGEATLKRAKTSGGHSLAGKRPDDVGTVAVRTSTLDGWMEHLGVDPDLVTFVKMDVQGWEGHAFAGATRLLGRRHVTWEIEYKPVLLRRAGTEPTALLTTLRQSFSHFTDLNKEATGDRWRPTRELEEAMAYVETSEAGQTDLLLFNQDA